MESFGTITGNRVLIAAVVAWFIAQAIKFFTCLIKDKEIRIDRIMGSGGMPSAHTASVMAATFSVGAISGYSSPEFGGLMIVAFIVMYDAAGVRRAAGKQAKAINTIVEELGSYKIIMDGQLKELLGHTYMEVFVGAALGIVIAIILN
ncbi:MAG: divergent PAP2 family protein [Vallitalea sp.]|nr:divergent PAP2 family protein [Vallitalea sp.]